MKSAAETLNDVAHTWHDRLDDEAKAQCEDILDAAEHFTNGALPIHEFAKLSTSRARFVALMSTPQEDRRRKPLLKAIDAVLRFQGLIMTTNGIWSPQEIGDAGMRIHPAPDPWMESA